MRCRQCRSIEHRVRLWSLLPERVMHKLCTSLEGIEKCIQEIQQDLLNVNIELLTRKFWVQILRSRDKVLGKGLGFFSPDLNFLPLPRLSISCIFFFSFLWRVMDEAIYANAMDFLLFFAAKTESINLFLGYISEFQNAFCKSY